MYGIRTIVQSRIQAHVKQVSEGIYQLKVSSGNCTGESKKIVVYKPKLSLPVTPADSAYFCEGKTVELKLPEAKGLRYRWQLNQQEIENATTASLTVNKSGVYRSLVYDEKCWDMSPSVKIGQLPTSQPQPVSQATSRLIMARKLS
jgi:hypothetical protein